MARYTVHAANGTDGLEGAIFLRDGFRVPAFLFGALWLIWHGAWRSALLVSAGFIAWFTLAFVLKLPPAIDAGGLFLLMLLIGFEGGNLIRWELGRKGLSEIGLVVGENRDEMERRFFAESLGEAPAAKSASAIELPHGMAPAPLSSPGLTSSVLGLFPGPAIGKKYP